REVVCPWLVDEDGVERPAYWRNLYCLGDLIPFWWCPADPDCRRPSYRPLTMREIRTLGLSPVLAYAKELARLSGLEWFSPEWRSDTPRGRRESPDGPGPSAAVGPLLFLDSCSDWGLILRTGLGGNTGRRINTILILY